MFLNESELTERRAFIESFVKEIVVGPGEARVRYTIPMPQDSRIAGMDAEEVAIPRPVLSTVNSGGHVLHMHDAHRLGKSLACFPLRSCHRSLPIASVCYGASFHRIASNCHSVPNAIYYLLYYDGTDRTIGSLDPVQRIESPSGQPSYLNTPVVYPVDRNRVYSRLARCVSELGNASNAAILSAYVFPSGDWYALYDLPFAVHTEEDTL